MIRVFFRMSVGGAPDIAIGELHAPWLIQGTIYAILRLHAARLR
jgi:hypothetical protein